MFADMIRKCRNIWIMVPHHLASLLSLAFEAPWPNWPWLDDYVVLVMYACHWQNIGHGIGL